MKEYLAKKGERLDQIVYAHYKSLEQFEKVLDCNKHLLCKLILNAGDKVYLPIIQFVEKETKRLWN